MIVRTKTAAVVLLALLVVDVVSSFVIQQHNNGGISAPRRTTSTPSTSSTTSSTRLHAIGALVRKAKEAELRQYVVDNPTLDETIMTNIKQIKEKSATIDLDTILGNNKKSPLQESLHRRKGTITVITEYKRKNDQTESGYINEIFDPEILSPTFREFGASAISVMADQRMGGCDYGDIQAFVKEQSLAHNQIPGPLPIINNDLVIDELQIARTAASGAKACVVTASLMTDTDELTTLIKAAWALDIEPIVAVSTQEEAQLAVDCGAHIISVTNCDGVDAKVAVIRDLKVPEGRTVTTIANIIANNDKQLLEIEEAWAIRDQGFQVAWVGEALYKGGANSVEHPGAIIKSIKAKSSLKWASPKATSGRGEGAREYLGDILM